MESFRNQEGGTRLKNFMKRYVSFLIFLLFFSSLAHAEYMKWVWVQWVDDGVTKTDLFYPGSSQTIYRDSGEPLSIR